MDLRAAKRGILILEKGKTTMHTKHWILLFAGIAALIAVVSFVVRSSRQLEIRNKVDSNDEKELSASGDKASELARLHEASSSELVTVLGSDDRDTVITALSILKRRHDPAGRKKALRLLESDNSYVWLNAALYLAELGDKRAVPYLIRGLKHPAWRSRDKVTQYLKALTGQSHGSSHEKWTSWWKKKNARSTVSLQPQDQGFEYDKGSATSYLITWVVDPLTVGHGEKTLKLAGITVAEGVSRERARRMVETAVLNQYVEIAPVDTVDSQKAEIHRGLVYWVDQGPSTISALDPRQAKGLGEVPFGRRTCVNAWLVSTGYYEINSKTITDPQKARDFQESVSKLKESASGNSKNQNDTNGK